MRLIIDHDTTKIDKLKKKLIKSFAMKDLDPAKQILGMKSLETDKIEVVVTSGKAC